MEFWVWLSVGLISFTKLFDAISTIYMIEHSGRGSINHEQNVIGRVLFRKFSVKVGAILIWLLVSLVGLGFGLISLALGSIYETYLFIACSFVVSAIHLIVSYTNITFRHNIITSWLLQLIVKMNQYLHKYLKIS